MRLLSVTKPLIAVLAVSLCAAGVAAAEGPRPEGTPPQAPPPGQVPMGIELTAVDTGARKVEGIQHCVEPSRAGQPAVFAVAPHVDMGFMAAGKSIGILVDTNTDPDTVVGAVDMDCRGTGPAGGGPGSGAPPIGGQRPPLGPGDQRPGGPGERPPAGHDGDGPPALDRGFLNRVWKFEGEVDSFESGKLSITVAKILNLPRKWRKQDDELVDEDALVLVSRSVRVYDDGRRVAQSRLEDAEHVRVQGKLLKPDKWQEDEDGTPVTTIRAKKIILVD